VYAERELSIAVDFANFGQDISQLRKKLRGMDGVQVLDSFPTYAALFRRRFNVRNDQAWDLFHQTVSMKSVGNLTDFVRDHMLEKPQVEQRINELIAHFEDLIRAHETVVKAKRQVQMLTPLVKDCDQYEEQTAGLRMLQNCRDGLKAYFSEIKLELIAKRVEHVTLEISKILTRKDRRQEQHAKESEDVRQLKQAIAEEGGDRLEQLDAELRVEKSERIRRQQRAERYAVLLGKLDVPAAATEEAAFDEQRSMLQTIRGSAGDEENRLQNRQVELTVDLSKKREEHKALADEIVSLKLRPSNIPLAQVQIRSRLCSDLQMSVADLPFAGELLQVRPDEARWEGAMERVLYSFAISLLVTEADYARVAAWVDATHLNGRLVYLRMRSAMTKGVAETLQRASLIHKLTVKPDTKFTSWLHYELRERFDYTCCATQEEFRREYRAVSLAGQIKDGGVRHVKDDRSRLDDRSRYVLGWSSEAKILVLEQKKNILEDRIVRLAGEISQTDVSQKAQRQKLDAIAGLQEFVAFREIDWRTCESAILRLREEKATLETASDTLATLSMQLGDAEMMLRASEAALSELDQRTGAENNRLKEAENLREQTMPLLAVIEPDVRQRLDEIRVDLAGDQGLTVESCDRREHLAREELQRRIDAENKQQARLQERIVRAMAAFKNDYKLETAEFDASLEAHAEYRELLKKLLWDDLPKYEKRFKEELNVNSIRRIAMFQANLNDEANEIKARIQRINESLIEIDYNRNRYIALMQQPTFNPEVRQFREDLRACIDNSLTASEDDHYSEAKFEQVKLILDRLRGRAGLTELDRRWKELVTDVRNWFQFSASEKWREDDREHEHYSDSGGKSGGQKEKLAYTILAASVAYQFGLEWVESKSRSFRFVVIDEAFGRGSDESAEYGLELFRKLNLQLLIVTPLQKTHIIEPYVASVGFVENRTGKSSTVLNLSIEEHRRQKAERMQ
jgi:uncharacterized protein YPO0396